MSDYEKFMRRNIIVIISILIITSLVVTIVGIIVDNAFNDDLGTLIVILVLLFGVLQMPLYFLIIRKKMKKLKRFFLKFGYY